MNSILSSLKWRYATKKFDSGKKISTQDLASIKEAINLTPSSYGLQPFKVMQIDSPELRAKIQPAAWGQSQIVDASHLFVFAHFTDIGEKEVAAYMQNKADSSGFDVSALKGYQDFIVGKIAEMSDARKSEWNARQTYLAVSTALNAAAELRIDACPMEGFELESLNEILGLKEKGLSAAVIVAVGYRSEEDETQNAPKIRKAEKDLFEIH